MSFAEYERQVVEKAYAKYKKPVCTDSVRDSYSRNKSIDAAVDDVVNDTVYWDLYV